MRTLACLLAVACFVWETSVALPENLNSSAARMLGDVRVLASDELEGRGLGTQGLEKAAQYIADEFHKAGLNVTSAGGDPYQEFDVSDGVELGQPNTLKLIAPDGTAHELEYDRNFRTCAFGSAGTFAAPVAFLGYGISASDVEYDDFEGVDVNGKVVIMMRRNPQQSDPHGPFAVVHGISRHAALTTKLSEAFRRGAVGVLFVNDPWTGENEQENLQKKLAEAQQQTLEVARQAAAPDADASVLIKTLREAFVHLDQLQKLNDEYDADPLMAFGYGGTRTGTSIPCFQITQEQCDAMLKPALGATLSELAANIDETGKPCSQDLPGWKAEGEANLNVVKIQASNVIGVLEGSGPLKDETIVIGAHFDHLGRGGAGSLTPGSQEIHNGADDNASGTAGLLELARRLAARPEPLQRRVVFIAFTGEERGLLGSEAYADDPLFPLEDTIAMLNMDMIGRMDEDKLTIFGTGTSQRWEELIDTLGIELGFKVSKKPEGLGPSDHSSFYSRKVPVLHFFTGTHTDYHRPSDDTDKINARDMERTVSMIEQIALNLAETPERPNYLEVAGQATLARSGSRPYFGSIPDFGSEAKGYAIQGVSPGSPAALGGLQRGDVIVRLNNQRIGGLDDFDLVLRNFAPGEQVDVVVLRDGQETPLKVTLGTPRG